MKKNLSILCLGFLFFVTNYAISSYEDMSKCDEILSNIKDESTLVVFDCEDVLLMHADLIFQGNNLKNQANNFKTKLQKLMGGDFNFEQNIVKIYSLLLLHRKVKLVDQNWPKQIKLLQGKNVKVLMLTNMFCGEYGVIPSVEDLFAENLLKFGIDFAASWPKVNPIKFNTFAAGASKSFPKTSCKPSYKRGMIFTANIDKGAVLSEFLRTNGRQFKAVVFIDDKIENLISVEKAMLSSGIKFTGIHYTKVADDHLNEAFDDDKISQQVDNLSNLVKEGI